MPIMPLIRMLASIGIPFLILLAATLLAGLFAYGLVLVWPTMPLAKVISKITQALLVLSLFPAMAYLKVNKTELGIADTAQFFKQLGQGFALGLVTLLPVFVVLYLLDINVLDQTQPWTLAWLAKNLMVSLLLALLISVLEEPLFRGVLLVGLRRRLPVLAAVVVSACYYAALHFIKTGVQIPVEEISFSKVLQLLILAYGNLLNPEIQPAFWALLMVGVFLGLLRSQEKTSLALCIGCHTAWVWLIKLNKSLFNTDYNADFAYLVSSYDGVIGPLVTGWLAAMMVGVYFVYQRIYRRDLPEPPPL